MDNPAPRAEDVVVWEGLTPPYRTIVADPPWPKRAITGTLSGNRRFPYSLMTLEDIAAMPVAELADESARLFLWVTAGYNRDGVGVATAAAWGFNVTAEIIWEKPCIGLGRFPRMCHEVLLIGSKGSMKWTGPRNVRSVQRWPQLWCGGRLVHSAKPAAAFDLVESVSPGPYVELFARRQRLGWDHWGYGFEERPVAS